MKITSFLLSATRILAVAGIAGASGMPAQAAALFTLKGTTPEVRVETGSEVRLSVLGWSDANQAAELVEQYRAYTNSKDHTAFGKFLQQADTKGYLFTKAASGYTVKYAWQDSARPDQRMVLLVIPGLKTRNPYMWKAANTDPAPFSLVEISWQGNEAIMKTSLDGPVGINADGLLQLQDFDAAAIFATLRDNTPYSIKHP
jgi:hypothetical protein